MPAPFPGMDPWLEEPSLWPDVQGSTLTRLRAALNAVLPERYTAFLDRYVWLEELDADERERLGTPDIYVTDQSPLPGGTASCIASTPPTVVTLPAVRREGERYLRIMDRWGRRVVTVIELLSPANKEAGPDRDNYLNKRNEYLATGTNLVEIDLLRAGARLPLGEPRPGLADYDVLVCRAAEFPRAGLWTFSVRDRIPTIVVPLTLEEDSVTVDLKPCLDRAYDEGRYSAEVNYAQPPTPPLREEDAAWARAVLAARGVIPADTTHQGAQP